jgi:adenylate cyclase
MSTGKLEVELADIPNCFEGVIPSSIATVGEDGTPNVTYLSVVHRIDDSHVALSRQFFNKTDHNTVVNPRAEVIVVDAADGRLFLLELKYVRTETEGELFERMRTKLDAVAAHEGMANVFRLRGTDVCEVTACRMLPSNPAECLDRRDVTIERVTEFSRQLAQVEDMEELLETALRACRELLGHPPVFIMLADESGTSLYTVASTGFDDPGTGSEVRIGEGLIGLAAARRESIRVTHMRRELSYSRATFAHERAGQGNPSIPLPRLPAIQSQLVTPMLAHRQLVGMLCLQSEEPGRFRASDEYVVAILANQLAVALVSLSPHEASPTASEPRSSGVAGHVKHYIGDDSVFLDNEYLIKGVPGAILWRLLRWYQEDGRSEFSNKELRLDVSLQLPDIKDNLEARLILLRRRLEEHAAYIRLERTARGRFRLAVTRELVLEEAP